MIDYMDHPDAGEEKEEVEKQSQGKCMHSTLHDYLRAFKKNDRYSVVWKYRGCAACGAARSEVSRFLIDKTLGTRTPIEPGTVVEF
jgi:hypothetical protein